MRILVIDDDYVSRTKIKAILSAYGDCDAAPDGFIAQDLFMKAHEEAVPYHLITVDINMPGRDGQDVVKNLRNAEKAEGISPADIAKIVMITVSSDLHDVSKSYYEGCHGYCVKPVTPQKMAEVLRNLGIQPPKN